MALFSVRTFGFPEIRFDDRPCRLALRKGLALLIYLAEAGAMWSQPCCGRKAPKKS